MKTHVCFFSGSGVSYFFVLQIG